MFPSPTRAVLGLTLILAAVFVWYAGRLDRWRSVLQDRFVYGVPWGTVLTVGVVVCFYLFAQGGVRQWNDPVVLPFVTWSYFYPTGLLTAGIAHGSPGHLLSNMSSTVAFAPIAEYAWGHYAASDVKTDRGESSHGLDSEPLPESGGDGTLTRLVETPWIRALVLFPGALLGGAFITAFFSMGPGLGFSGALFAIAGFAVVTYPLASVVAVVAGGAVGTLFQAFSEPILRAGIESGTPGPPAWASIAFQAHLLGFLIGVLLGTGLLWHRRSHPALSRVFFATFLLGVVQALWLVVWPEESGEFVLYRGAGTVLVVLLAMLVTVAVAGSDRSLEESLPVLDRSPKPSQLALVWVGLLGLGFLGSTAGVISGGTAVVSILPLALVVLVAFALPALPALLSDRLRSHRLSRRGIAIAAIVLLAVVVATPGVLFSLTTVESEAVPDSGEITVGEYTVTYVENVTSGQTLPVEMDEENASRQSGVIVVNPERELWTVGVQNYTLEFEGEGTVTVGGLGWRESVQANRTGWEVTGNESAYVVDLESGSERVRSFESDPVTANAQVAGYRLTVVPSDDGFAIRAARNGTTAGTIRVPEADETVQLADLSVSTETVDGSERVFVSAGGSRVQIAQREEY